MDRLPVDCRPSSLAASDRNPFLAEYPLDYTLSGRLYPKSRFTILKPASDEAINTHDDLEGSFRGVPNEIIHQIFQQLDLASLANLACTSKGMGRVVRGLPELRPLLSCAPDAMRAVTAAKVGDRLVCSDMYRKLVKPECDDCSSPGEYLHLLTCSRLCFKCMRRNPRYRALRPMQAVEQYSLPLCDVTSLPALEVPRYSTEGYYYRRLMRRLQINTTGWRLIDKEDVYRLSIETHGSVDEAKRLASERLTKLRLPYGSPITNEEWLELSKQQRRTDLMARRQSRGMPRQRRQRRQPFEDRLRAHIPPDVESAYSVSTLFPWFDMSTYTFGRPGSCELCRDAGLPQHECYYTVPGYECHMKKHTTRGA